MNNEDMSEIIQKMTDMLNNSNIQQSDNNQTNSPNNDVSSNSEKINEDTLKNILNNFKASSEEQNSNNNFNFDINTMLKMKNIMDKMNSNSNDPRTNLLLSLKPYLNNNRKEKLDQYMQFLNISKVIEVFQSEGGADKK